LSAAVEGNRFDRPDVGGCFVRHRGRAESTESALGTLKLNTGMKGALQTLQHAAAVPIPIPA
jgi:hypothetical protein